MRFNGKIDLTELTNIIDSPGLRCTRSTTNCVIITTAGRLRIDFHAESCWFQLKNEIVLCNENLRNRVPKEAIGADLRVARPGALVAGNRKRVRRRTANWIGPEAELISRLFSGPGPSH